MGNDKYRIKTTPKNKSSRFQSPESTNYNKCPIVFSLEKIISGKYCLSNLDQANKAMFADAIYKRKNLTWDEIYCTGRHQLGCETISRSSIKAPIPATITDEVTDFLVFRYHGKQPMVGIRTKDVFFVLWFDFDFTLYKHKNQ